MNSNSIAVFLTLALLGSTFSPDALSGEEEAPQSGTFTKGILYRDTKGVVWVGEPLVSLGMIGVSARSAKYRLAPELAKRLAPLVNDIKEAPVVSSRWLWGLPEPKKPDDPVTLVRIDYEAEFAEYEKPEDGVGHSESKIYEVKKVRLTSVEFISARWRQAWNSLSEGLEAIVQASLREPSDEKSERLSKLIGTASHDLNSMVAEKVEAESQEIVNKIEPGARCVRLFQRRIEGSLAGNWGGQLRFYVNTLGITPSIPLPEEEKPFPGLRLLSESASPEELLAEVRKSWAPQNLNDWLIYSSSLGRLVSVWQVEELDADEFATLREEALEELERTEKRAKPEHPERFEIPEWGANLKPADSELLAENLLLEGVVVEAVSADGSPIGLQTGDIIVDYTRTYDLVAAMFRSHKNRLSSKAKFGGRLRVLREGKFIELEVEESQ